MEAILEMRGIGKSFGNVRALDDVNLTVRAGDIHAVCGENGAGKSTLMKILSGVYPHGSYSGAIAFEGQERQFGAIHDSEAAGVIIIHQELALVPMLSIAENIFLGNEQARAGFIDWAASYAQTEALLARVGLRDAPGTPVGRLGVGKQQLVEIAKALSKKVKLLILDEPTASLNDDDSDRLLGLLLELKARGVTAIIISHKLGEIARVADAVTVIRDGATVDAIDCRDGPVSEDRIIRAMVGRDMADRYPKRIPAIGTTVFEVRNWQVRHPVQRDRMVIDDVSFHARAGEVVGIAGLMGAGRTELAMSVFGRAYGFDIRGEVWLHGKKVDVSTVRKAIAAGLAYVTEDRKGDGLLLDDSIAHNVTLANLSGVARGMLIDAHREGSVARDYLARLRIRCASVTQAVGELSGGNQQKVVLSKWLYAAPDVLILDEPTRGIDVGAKYEIYAIVNDLVASGKCVVMISSEMPELLGMCDRIYVMNEGRFVGEFDAGDATQEKIMRSIVKNGGN